MTAPGALRVCEVGGLALHYTTAGDGEEAVVLLHGLGESATSWRWVSSRLARRYTVVAVDLPGLGRSLGAVPDYSARAMARHLVGFLDALGIDRACVVGSSLGGQVGIHLGLAVPERTTALVLLASAGLGREISVALRLVSLPSVGELELEWGKTRPGAWQRAYTRAALLFGQPWAVRHEWVAEQAGLGMTAGFLQANLAALRAHVDVGGQREVLLDRLPGLDMPTLIVWGTRDRILPARHGLQAARRVPGARMITLRGFGHNLPVEAPTESADVVRRFVASTRS